MVKRLHSFDGGEAKLQIPSSNIQRSSKSQPPSLLPASCGSPQIGVSAPDWFGIRGWLSQLGAWSFSGCWMLALGASCLVGGILCASSLARGADAKEEAAWQPLFNGKDLSGWVPMNDAVFFATNGCIHL